MLKTAILTILTGLATFTCGATGRPCEKISPASAAFNIRPEEVPTAEEMLQQIIEVTGLRPNFELKKGKVKNIEASISRRKRYILYNPDFINQINNLTHDKWATMALLAHEVGHHLNGHTIRNTGSTPELELEADEFAGFVLFKLGAPLDKAQEVMKYISKTEASSTHPGRAARMQAIETGWNRAAANVAKNSRLVTTLPPADPSK